MPTADVNASDRTLGIVTALSAAAMLLLLVTPRASPATLALLLMATGGGLAPSMDALRRLSTPVVLLLALGAWAALSTIWAADREIKSGRTAPTAVARQVLADSDRRFIADAGLLARDRLRARDNESALTERCSLCNR